MARPRQDPLRLTLAVGTRQLAKAQTRERVREAARALFLARGFVETTAQMVAEDAGVAVGTVFQHASDKEDLLLLVVEPPMARAIAEASSHASDDDLLTAVTRMFAALLEVYVELDASARPALRAQWFGAGPNARAAQWQYETFLEQVVRRLTLAQEDGALADGADLRTLVGNLSGIYQGVALEWLWGDAPLDEAVARLRAGFALQLIPLQTTMPGPTA